MYMFNQARKRVADYKSFRIEMSGSFSKDKKVALTGYEGGFAGEADVLAYFPDEKTAIDELERIFAAIEAGEKTYTIKQN